MKIPVPDEVKAQLEKSLATMEEMSATLHRVENLLEQMLDKLDRL